jgi:hypothetical protein
MQLSSYSSSSSPVLGALPKRAVVLQRQGLQWKPPPHWNFEHIEYRGSMLLALAFVPLLRYTQDTPEDKNALLARDLAALGSATCLYLFMQSVLSNGVHALANPKVMAKVPTSLKGFAKAIAADANQNPHKNHFFSYIPSQIISLTTSALVGSFIGNQAMQHLKHIQQWMQAPDKVGFIQNAWQSQDEADKKRALIQNTVGGIGFLGLLPLSYWLLRHKTPKVEMLLPERPVPKKASNRVLTLVNRDFPAVVSALLGGLGLGSLAGATLADAHQIPPKKKVAKGTSQVENKAAEDHSLKGELKHAFFHARRDESGEVEFKLRAPALGIALLATTYMGVALTALGYSLKHHNNPKALDKLYNYEQAYHVMRWLLPSLILPSIRYARDPKDKRDEFYIRDFTYTWLGMVIYWTTKVTALKAIHHFNWVGLPKGVSDPKQIEKISHGARNLMAASMAMIAQTASNGLLAPRFSHDFVHYLNTPTHTSNSQKSETHKNEIQKDALTNEPTSTEAILENKVTRSNH